MNTLETVQPDEIQNIKNHLTKLETENLLKNAFLADVREQLSRCYDEQLNLKQDNVKRLLSTINSQIDGLQQTAFD